MQVWAEVKGLPYNIMGLWVEHGGQEYSYQDICSKWKSYSVLSFAVLSEAPNEGVFKGQQHDSPPVGDLHVQEYLVTNLPYDYV